jgi:hypothetical protein
MLSLINIDYNFIKVINKIFFTLKNFILRFHEINKVDQNFKSKQFIYI